MLSLSAAVMCVPVCSCRLVSALTQRLLGGLLGLLEAAFLKFYQYVVDPAEPGTWPIRFFTWAATGPIK